LVHDSSYKRLLHEIDIVVVPNTNPDGYEFSRESNRMWRKTRSNSTVSRFSQLCSGVDANRNYPFHFGEEGVSHWPCQETYCGRVALSEPEVMGLAAAILERKNEIRGYVALHSFGQDILYPWGHKVNEYPPDVEDLKSMANGVADAIYSVYGTRYLVSNSAAGLYPASGAADDWAKSIGVKYSFTFELSPTTMEPGFLLPEADIPRVTREVMEGIVFMARRIRSEEVGRLLNDIISSRPIRRRSQRLIG
ncbi:zinc carboxypeptidase, partial [Cooperia oncophora]